MTTVPYHHAAGAAPPALRTGRWRLPGGRSATAHTRRAIHTALRRWGLGPAADALAHQVVSLIQESPTRSAAHSHGPIDLRLELRPADRLLLGEIQAATPDRLVPDDPTPAGRPEPRRSIIALTYGHRPARNGTATWYTHAFTWYQSDANSTDRRPVPPA
ncbi:hypothetical protein GCM10010191_46460 [Actinomadura vinacea]|uniref:ATP-binding protein n=1 Tax=Actinomadura vinacea TaxID=115336 RepID=A0ABN3JED8_9ACTN